MPLDRNSPVAANAGAYSPWDPNPHVGERAERPGTLAAAGAAFGTANTIGAVIVSEAFDIEKREYFRVDPDYNPFTSGDLEGYEDHADRFLESFNAKRTEAIKSDIDREKKDRETIEAAGWVGVGANFVASVLDWPTLLPGGAFVRGSKLGYSGLKSALSVSTAAGAGTALQEGMLHATQQTRTLEESGIAIGGSVILGGLLGAGGAGLLSRAEFDQFSKALELDIADTTPTAVDLAEAAYQKAVSGGAAAVKKVRPEDLEIEGVAAQKLVAAQAAIQLTPAVRMMNSKSTKAREIQLKLAETHIVTKGQAEGSPVTGAAVETNIKQGYARNATFQSGIRKAWKAARRNGYNKSEAEFREAAGKAARRADYDPTNEHVTALAKSWHQIVADPGKLDSIAVGLLPADFKLKTSPRYLTRIYSREKIFADPEGFREIIRNHIRQGVEAADARGDGLDFSNDLDMKDYVEEIVGSVFDNATGRARADVPSWVVPINRGPLKGRTLNIQDALLEPFLENDIAVISEAYTRTVIPDIEMTRAFGSADMADAFRELKQDYDELIRKAQTPEEKTALEKAFRKDEELLKAQRDVIRNSDRVAETHNIRGQLTRLALTWNLVRLLGGQTLSSTTDLANVLTAQGMDGFMKDALPALISKTRAAKISRHDAKSTVTILETATSARMASMSGLDGNGMGGNSLDHFSGVLAHYFSKATGIDLWNSWTKQTVAMMTTNRILKNSMDALAPGAGGKQVEYARLSKRQRRFMGVLNIPEEMATRFARQAERYGSLERGVWGANLDAWTDREAARVFRSAMLQESDRVIVTPGAADTPLWMNTNTGRLIGQFRRIAFASNQRVLFSKLQGRPRDLAQFLAVGVPIGMLISYLKYIERADWEGAQKLLDNPGLWIYEGVDRLGVAAFITEPSNILDRIGFPYTAQTAFQLAAGDDELEGAVSRYAPRGGIGAVLGPSVGLFEDLKDIATEAQRGDLTKRGANAAIGLIPGGTLPGVKTYMHREIKPWLEELVE